MAITLTLQKVVQETGLSLRTIQNAIERGELYSIRVGRRRLIPVRALEEFLFRTGKVAGGQRKGGQ